MTETVQISDEAVLASFDQAPEAMIVSDAFTGCIVHANRSASELCGISFDVYPGLKRSDLYRSDASDQISRLLAGSNSDETAIFETSLKNDEREGACLEVKASLVHNSGKSFILEVLRDGTSDQLQLQDLRESEDRLNEALRLAGIGSWELDLCRNRIFWSPEVFSIFDIDREKFGASYEAFLNACHPDDRAAVNQAYKQSLKTGTPYSIDHRIVLPDGRIRFVHERCRTYYGDEGKPVRSIGTVLDITEKRLAEEELEKYRSHLELLVEERTAALKASNEELERFAYIASHDLQEPLRMVTSYLQLLEKRFKHLVDPDAAEFMNFAVDGAKRMKTLINDLLAYSRIGTKKKNFEPVDTVALVDEVLENLEISIAENKAVFIREPLPTVIADRSQLLQLFQNIIGNAVKFHAEKTPEIRIRSETDDAFFRFYIQDNGIGIDPQYFAMIFQVFQRLHGRNEYPGNGIGLSICRKIVERHGGTIGVESEPGRGTTFIFTISRSLK